MKSKSERKAKQYYISCMDANETIETLGAKPMLDLLDDVGGWSINGKFNISNWSLQESMHVLQNVYNMGGLFSWAVNEDDRNSSRHIIQVSIITHTITLVVSIFSSIVFLLKLYLCS